MTCNCLKIRRHIFLRVRSLKSLYASLNTVLKNSKCKMIIVSLITPTKVGNAQYRAHLIYVYKVLCTEQLRAHFVFCETLWFRVVQAEPSGAERNRRETSSSERYRVNDSVLCAFRNLLYLNLIIFRLNKKI